MSNQLINEHFLVQTDLILQPQENTENAVGGHNSAEADAAPHSPTITTPYHSSTIPVPMCVHNISATATSQHSPASTTASGSEFEAGETEQGTSTAADHPMRTRLKNNHCP